LIRKSRQLEVVKHLAGIGSKKYQFMRLGGKNSDEANCVLPTRLRIASICKRRFIRWEARKLIPSFDSSAEEVAKCAFEITAENFFVIGYLKDANLD
jgi:hypothetical protein